MKRVIILVAFVFCMELFGCSQSAVSIEWDFENSSMDLNTQKNYTEALLKFMDELNECGGDISKDEYLVCVDDETITMCQSNVIYVNTGEINSPYTFLKIFLH